MRDHRTTKHIAYTAWALWGIAGLMIASAWYDLLVVQPDNFSVPGMFAITAAVLAAAASALSNRLVSMRLQRLVRLTAGLVYDDRPGANHGRHEAHNRARKLTSVR